MYSVLGDFPIRNLLSLSNFLVVIYCRSIPVVPLSQSTSRPTYICHHINPEIALVPSLTLAQGITLQSYTSTLVISKVRNTAKQAGGNYTVITRTSIMNVARLRDCVVVSCY